MSIVPFSALSPADLASLGNNIGPAKRRRHRNLAAINRSLAVLGEAVASVHASRHNIPAWLPLRTARRYCR